MKQVFKKIYNYIKYVIMKIINTIISIFKTIFKKLIPNIFRYFVSTLEAILFSLIIDVLLIYFIINNNLQQFLMTSGIYLSLIISNMIRKRNNK